MFDLIQPYSTYLVSFMRSYHTSSTSQFLPLLPSELPTLLRNCMQSDTPIDHQVLSILSNAYNTLPFTAEINCIVKAMVFLVVMYGCESGTKKKAEQPRNDAFILW